MAYFCKKTEKLQQMSNAFAYILPYHSGTDKHHRLCIIALISFQAEAEC